MVRGRAEGRREVELGEGMINFRTLQVGEVFWWRERELLGVFG